MGLVIQKVQQFFRPDFQTNASGEFTPAETFRFHLRNSVLSSYETLDAFRAGVQRFAERHPHVVLGAAVLPVVVVAATVSAPAWVVGGLLAAGAGAACVPETEEDEVTLLGPDEHQEDIKGVPADSEMLAQFDLTEPCAVPSLGEIPRPAFREASSQESGLTAASWFRMDINPQHGPGGCLFDAEQDGDIDLFMVGQARDYLYLNDGQARFSALEGEPSGFENSAGCLPADFDGDTNTDLLVFGNGIRLYQNQGDLSFGEIHASVGLDQPQCLALGAAACDVDHNGSIDLALACQMGENMRSMGGSLLFVNDGDSFAEEGRKRGISFGGSPTFAISCLDMNGDESPDFFEGNDAGRVIRDHLWLNDGEGYFYDAAEAFGLDRWTYESSDGQTYESSADTMGIGAADFFLHRHPAVAMSDYGYPERRPIVLLRATEKQEGDIYLYREIGPQGGMSPSGYTSWGVMDVDVDLDGDPDMLVATGAKPVIPGTPPIRTTDFLYLNQGGIFSRYQPSSGDPLSREAESYAVLVGDLDGDGDEDAVILSHEETPQLLLNQAALGNWAKLDLQCPPSNTHCLGAKVLLQGLSGGCSRMEQKIAGEGYASGVEGPFVFGLGELLEVQAIVLYEGRTQEVVLRAGEVQSVSF